MKLTHEPDTAGILHTLVIFTQEWPERDLFRWAKADELQSKAEWIADHAHLWQVWQGGRLVGYFAAVDFGRGRWSVHFGGRRPIPSGRAMLVAWRKLQAVFRANGVRLLVAYIPPERPEIQRAARIFQFRQFKTLWALNLKHPISNLHPRRHLPSRPKTKA
jgi:hypothetical protein